MQRVAVGELQHGGRAAIREVVLTAAVDDRIDPDAVLVDQLSARTSCGRRSPTSSHRGAEKDLRPRHEPGGLLLKPAFGNHQPQTTVVLLELAEMALRWSQVPSASSRRSAPTIESWQCRPDRRYDQVLGLRRRVVGLPDAARGQLRVMRSSTARR